MAKMTDQQKGSLMNEIIGVMKGQAQLQNKHFDGGSVFFSLAFKTDKELKRIAKLCGIG